LRWSSVSGDGDQRDLWRGRSLLVVFVLAIATTALVRLLL
jgi:hypothetical protein